MGKVSGLKTLLDPTPVRGRTLPVAPLKFADQIMIALSEKSPGVEWIHHGKQKRPKIDRPVRPASVGPPWHPGFLDS